MDVYAQIVIKIIQAQEAIIGPVAVEQAQHIPNLTLDWPHHTVTVTGDQVKVVSNLVEVYKELFGQISVEVSKESVAALASQLLPHQIPESLK